MISSEQYLSLIKLNQRFDQSKTLQDFISEISSKKNYLKFLEFDSSIVFLWNHCQSENLLLLISNLSADQSSSPLSGLQPLSVSLWIGLSLYNIHYPCFGKRCINRKRPKWHSSLIDFLSHNPRGGITITVTTTIPTEQDDSKLWRVLLVREINFSTRQTHFKSKEYLRSGLTQHWTSNSNAPKTFVLTKQKTRKMKLLHIRY